MNECSYCRKTMPTADEKATMKIGPSVCLCDHNWLHLPIDKRPTPRPMPMLSLPAKPKAERKDATE